MPDKSVQWTPQQREGIETTGANLLVSAAAGSGKTAVLAARCAYLLCDAPKPCSVDELLVVTFTENAAAQMKDRIRAALEKRQAADPENPRLLDALAHIDRAQVSTLHGFCSRLLRQHFHVVGLDPSFTVLEGEEAKVLRQLLARELLADRYETDEAGTFQQLVDFYADGDDGRIQKLLLHVHELLGSLIDPDGWLKESAERLSAAATQPFVQTTIGREIQEIIRTRVESLCRNCADAVRVLRPLQDMAKVTAYVETIGDTVNNWLSLCSKGNLAALASAVANYAPGKTPSIKETNPDKPAAKAVLDSIKEDLGEKSDLQLYLRFTPDDWQQGVRSLLPFAHVFLDLVKEFGVRYTAAKSRLRAVDFADLERLALQILRVDSSPSPAAVMLQKSLAHVLVDEYQDINAVQDEILRLVSREQSRSLPPNLFCVGDVKQSIYRFRLAEPQRFLDRYARYRKNTGGRVIDLQANFRSRAPLLEAINGLFERLMTLEAADIAYDASQRLIPNATYPAPAANTFSGAPIELHIIPSPPRGDSDESDDDTDLDRTDREALFVARRILELTGATGLPAMNVAAENDTGEQILRPLEFRDITIILRSPSHKAAHFAAILNSHGIPVYRESASGFFDSPEVRDLLSLLQLLDNTHQDIPLAAVLRSPMSRVQNIEDALAKIRLAYPSDETSVPFHEAFLRYAREQRDDLAAALRNFLADLDRWRSAARFRPLSQVIWTILEETGYLTYCSALENGEQRVANLLHLHDRAKNAGVAAGRGLYRFLRTLERLRDDADLGPPAAVGENENVVRILSVHKSKGLEFPVVFLPDLGKGFNLKDLSARILADRSQFLGLPAIDIDKQARYPSAPYVILQHHLRRQTMAEELRILYVAMTRAKEHLILVGAANGTSINKWQLLAPRDAAPLAADNIVNAKSALAWIVPVAAALPNAYRIIEHGPEEVAQWDTASGRRDAFTRWQIDRAALKPLSPAPSPQAAADEVFKRLAHGYAFEYFTRARAALAATEYAKRDAKSSPVFAGPVTLPVPKFVTAASPSGTDRGTATHLVLEHFKFGEDISTIPKQIADMVARRLITHEQGQMVDIAAIEWFAATPLAARIRAAAQKDLLAELPFTYAVQSEQSTDAMDRFMVRGRIDLLIREGRECIVVDYKTDAVTGDALRDRAAVYAKQLQFYREALERLTNLRVARASLVFLHPKEIIDC